MDDIKCMRCLFEDICDTDKDCDDYSLMYDEIDEIMTDIYIERKRKEYHKQWNEYSDGFFR